MMGRRSTYKNPCPFKRNKRAIAARNRWRREKLLSTVTQDRHKKWMQALNRNPDEIISSDSSICSNHFVDDDFAVGKNGKSQLKPNAVPSVNLKPTSGQKQISSSIIAEPSKPSENSTQCSCPPAKENNLPRATGPRPRYIIIIRRTFHQNQRFNLPEVSPSVQNSNENKEQLGHAITKTGDTQDQSTSPLKTNDEKAEETRFEFVDCACKTPDEYTKCFITEQGVMVKEEVVEEEFGTTTPTCVKIENEESLSISCSSLKQPDESGDDVKIPYVINHELFIKDETIGEEGGVERNINVIYN